LEISPTNDTLARQAGQPRGSGKGEKGARGIQRSQNCKLQQHKLKTQKLLLGGKHLQTKVGGRKTTERRANKQNLVSTAAQTTDRERMPKG
jgi:hypothetical protein